MKTSAAGDWKIRNWGTDYGRQGASLWSLPQRLHYTSMSLVPAIRSSVSDGGYSQTTTGIC